MEHATLHTTDQQRQRLYNEVVASDRSDRQQLDQLLKLHAEAEREHQTAADLGQYALFSLDLVTDVGDYPAVPDDELINCEEELCQTINQLES